jgi:hypothetical protein
MKLRLTAILALMISLQASAKEPASRPKTAPAQNEPLRQELLWMFKLDQKVRIEGLQALHKQGVAVGQTPSLGDPKVLLAVFKQTFSMTVVDDAHRRRLDAIIDQHGWPGKTLVGADGANAAWLIAQHADLDRAFQKKCLEKMEAMPRGEVEPRYLAYLTDRILVGEHKPQRFGTQLDGHFKPQPIEDEANVDKRRADRGLNPLAEYLKEAKDAYEQMARGEKASKK